MKYFFAVLIPIIIAFGFLAYIKRNSVVTRVEEVKTQIEAVKDTIAPQPTKIEPNGLPNQHLIQTAFVEQAPEKNWDEPWQDACEEASMLTVDAFYRHLTPTVQQQRDLILKMIDYETSQGMGSDINTAQMSQVAVNYLKLKPQILNNPDIDQIKKYIFQDIPVIIPADGKILFAENKHFKDGGPYYHNIVVLGYDDTKQQFIVHDVGTQFGAYFHYSYDLLIESIHDFPDSGRKEDILSGSKKALVLLQ